MGRYKVYVDGVLVGSRSSVEEAQALVLAKGRTAPLGSVLVFQIKLNGEVIGEGELSVDPRP